MTNLRAFLAAAALILSTSAAAAPTVSLKAPANNASYLQPVAVTVSANASASSGTTLTQVEFYAGTTLIGTDTTSPYSISWANVPAGVHSLTAKARDNTGAATTSAARTITVSATNTAPTVSLSGPANNSTWVTPTSITVSATAKAPETNDTVAKVEFYAGATLIGTDTSSPYSISWAGPPAGVHTLTARAYDAQGGVTTSAARTITVNAANLPPTVSLSAPANNSTWVSPAAITVSATAKAPETNDTIAKVEFYAGTTLIGTDTSSPYSISWASPPAGVHTITARAYDAQGGVTTSAARTITVNTNNLPPSVNLTAPVAGSSYTAPASITLVATAADSDGSIASVAFYNGATLIGSGTLAGGSYTFTWTNVAAGSYSVTARATDNQGATADSAPVAVTVTTPAPPPVAAGVYYIYADHLNTPRVITDTTNKIVWRWDSGPFGADAANEDPDGDGQKFSYNLRFPGQYYDRETGLHYNYFRDYEPGTGRYVQADPIGLAGGLNLYAYVDGNPLSYIDPLGLAACLAMFPDMPIDTGLGFTSTRLGGHGGILTYDSKGGTQYHEYGRYSTSQAIGVGLPSDEGNVRRITVPNLKIDNDGLPTPESLEALKKALEKNAGKGTNVNLTCDANSDENKIRDYIKKLAEDANRSKYSWKPWNSNQCRDFANRAFNTGR